MKQQWSDVLIKHPYNLLYFCDVTIQKLNNIKTDILCEALFSLKMSEEVVMWVCINLQLSSL